MKRPPATPRPPAAFTLLELVLALALMGIVVGMVLATARSSLGLGQSIVKNQSEEMLNQAFFELLSQRFAALPGNTRFDLKSEDSGAHYLSDLTLQNVPLNFTWGGQDRIAKAVQLSTVKRRSGYLDIVLRYYENECLPDSASTFGSTVAEEKPFAEIVLLEDVAFFEWRVLDGRSLEWQYDWDIQGRLPLQIELTMAIGAQGQEIRHVFWLPPKQNPEVVMRQTGQGTTAPTTGDGSTTIEVGMPGSGGTVPGSGGGNGGNHGNHGDHGGHGGPPPPN